MDKRKEIDIKDYLALVQRPSRYIGGEVNSVVKDLSKVKLAFGLAFPDVYEVGMSHLGMQILYQILNGRDDIACERVFAPWDDMEALLREKGAPLATLENSVALADLDILGFSLQYELSFTNVLMMLDLGGVPLRSSERGEGDPIVIGGGPAAFNPEPIAPFFDAFLLGDGEEAVVEIAGAVIAAKAEGAGREETLRRLARIVGVYVPAFFDVTYNEDGTVREITPLVEGCAGVRKRFVADINGLPRPTTPVVPFAETVHDRLTVEIARGCTRGCRFCQAGMIYRPARERTPDNIVSIIDEGIGNTGYDEISFLSLSTGDYTLIEDLLSGLMSRFAEEKVAVSLPSLRVGTLSSTVANEIKRVRKTGFTLAPEAGSDRLRQLINKGIKEEDLLAAARDIFTLGWKSMKLYFMLGLPTETDADLDAIVELARCLRRIGSECSRGRPPQINVSVATFIPKPYTPFQWEPQLGIEESRRRQLYVRNRLGRKTGFRWHDPEMSFLEGVFARGDRRLAPAVEKAFELGCRFDGWGDRFDLARWKEVFDAAGIDPDFYVTRRRGTDEVLPWDHLDSAVNKRFLREEYDHALALEYTPDCKVDRCADCGVCDHKVIKNRTVDGEEVRAGGGEEARSGSSAEDGYKLRLTFAKTGPVRFLGHLELVKAISRAVKRAGVPVRYSGGFHPKPKMSFSQPLPVGMESVDEWMEIELAGGGEMLDVADVAARLNRVLPEGIKFSAPDGAALKLDRSSDIVDTAVYIIFIKDGPVGLDIDSDRLERLIRDFKDKESAITRIRKKDKVVEADLSKAVIDLAVTGEALAMTLGRADRVSVRPRDVLEYLFRLSPEDAALIPVIKTGRPLKPIS